MFLKSLIAMIYERAETVGFNGIDLSVSYLFPQICAFFLFFSFFVQTFPMQFSFRMDFFCIVFSCHVKILFIIIIMFLSYFCFIILRSKVSVEHLMPNWFFVLWGNCSSNPKKMVIFFSVSFKIFLLLVSYISSNVTKTKDFSY